MSPDVYCKVHSLEIHGPVDVFGCVLCIWLCCVYLVVLCVFAAGFPNAMHVLC